ncbi:YegP family protein [Arthrobacter sp. MPF02]|uniref:YegP family protein n=1 Tax=Arthrobacter sp. MPF02 TaxID=3388492 RepID=UPI0039855927
MAGNFEVFVDSESLFRFRLLGPDGTVMAVSRAFEDKTAVAAGIAAVRECAGTGLVTDLCPPGAVVRPAPAAEAVSVARPDCRLRMPVKAHPAALAAGSRKLAATPRWIRVLAS